MCLMHTSDTRSVDLLDAVGDLRRRLESAVEPELRIPSVVDTLNGPAVDLHPSALTLRDGVILPGIGGPDELAAHAARIRRDEHDVVHPLGLDFAVAFVVGLVARVEHDVVELADLHVGLARHRPDKCVPADADRGNEDHGQDDRRNYPTPPPNVLLRRHHAASLGLWPENGNFTLEQFLDAGPDLVEPGVQRAPSLELGRGVVIRDLVPNPDTVRHGGEHRLPRLDAARLEDPLAAAPVNGVAEHVDVAIFRIDTLLAEILEHRVDDLFGGQIHPSAVQHFETGLNTQASHCGSDLLLDRNVVVALAPVFDDQGHHFVRQARHVAALPIRSPVPVGQGEQNL